MERKDICILINSTPKYYFMLPFMVGMIRRYSPRLRWPIYLATEVPSHLICHELAGLYNVRILPIPHEKSGFLDSRQAALAHPELEGFKYVLPLQDDFILEMPVRGIETTLVTSHMDLHPEISSARLMPCPGPKGTEDEKELKGWKVLRPTADEFGFTFQATLWRREACLAWYTEICNRLEEFAPRERVPAKDRLFVEITHNFAENSDGQAHFWRLSLRHGWRHIAWVRQGSQPNAVYLSPFPYRPTAIVKGSIEPWATELARREGFKLA